MSPFEQNKITRGARWFAVAVMMAALFFATDDWTQPSRSVRRLALPAVAVVLAFAALYYLEHYYYPAHY